MSKFRNIQLGDGKGLAFYCHGCGQYHFIDHRCHIEEEDGLPTVKPSILVWYPWGDDQEMRRCHLLIKRGKIQYLKDCTHELAGMTVDM